LMNGTDGRIITTGMGKAGHIARKFAATLASTGTPSMYVHPGEAAHGDLGILHKEDTIVAMSTSGKTTEVLSFLQQAGELFDLPCYMITSHPGSVPDRLIVGHVLMPTVVEADPLQLVPTTSTILMLAICDEIAIQLMVVKNINVDDFAARHHGGYLGEAARGWLSPDEVYDRLQRAKPSPEARLLGDITGLDPDQVFFLEKLAQSGIRK